MKTISSLAVGADKHSRGLVLPLASLQTQAGVVMVVSLIILLLLTIIGLSAMQTTALEEKMAGNLRDKNLAFQSAESALRFAECSIEPTDPTAVYNLACTKGLCLDNNPLTPNPIPAEAAILMDSFWSSSNASLFPTYTVALGNGIHAPVNIFQKLPEFPPPPALNNKATVVGTNSISIKCQPYKTTLRATGGTTNTVVILQSVVVWPICP